MQLHRIAAAARAASARSGASSHLARSRFTQAQALVAGFATAPRLRDACLAGKPSPCSRTAELLRRADATAATSAVIAPRDSRDSPRDTPGSIELLPLQTMGHITIRAPVESLAPESGIEPLPVPWRITLDTNPDDCNLSCVMCEQHSVFSDAHAKREAAGQRRRRMKPELIDAVLAGLPIGPDGLREVIPSTMGEPLMYAHLDRIVEAIRSRPGLRMNLTTNGTFPPGKAGRSPEAWARYMLPLISDVKISWNGASAATQEGIMRNAKFSAQLANLRTWIRVRDELASQSPLPPPQPPLSRLPVASQSQSPLPPSQTQPPSPQSQTLAKQLSVPKAEVFAAVTSLGAAAAAGIPIDTRALADAAAAVTSDAVSPAVMPRHRANITLQLTFMRRNLAEIPRIVQLAAREGVDRVKGHHLWAHFAEIKDDDLRRSAESVAAWNACVDECRAIVEAQRLPNGQRVRLENFEHLSQSVTQPVRTEGQKVRLENLTELPLVTASANPLTAAGVADGASAGTLPAAISASAVARTAPLHAAPLVDADSECPFLGREAWVNHAGDFAPCCAPDEQRRSLGDFGDVGTTPGGLLGIWRSQQYRELCSNYKSKPLCQSCQMRKKPSAAAGAKPLGIGVAAAQARGFSTSAAARRAVDSPTGALTTSTDAGSVTQHPLFHPLAAPEDGRSGVLLVNHGYPPLYNAGSEIDTQSTALGLRRSGHREWSRVRVLAREEDVFRRDYDLRTVADALDGSIPVHLVNNPREASYARFANDGIDNAFRAVMGAERPRVVHFGHVNHLSVRLPAIARREYGAAVVFTLHDFFQQCPRGQFLRVGPPPPGAPLYELCSKQEDHVCASRCFARFATGLSRGEGNGSVQALGAGDDSGGCAGGIHASRAGFDDSGGYAGGIHDSQHEPAPRTCTSRRRTTQVPAHGGVGTMALGGMSAYHTAAAAAGGHERAVGASVGSAAASGEIAYWSRWVGDRQAAFRAMCSEVHAFTAPSRSLQSRFIADMGIAPERVHYLPYGFDHARLAGRRRRAVPTADGPLTLAYIGRHIPAKGIDLLVQAAHAVVQKQPSDAARLRILIFGREGGANTASIRRLMQACTAESVALGVPAEHASALIAFRPEYSNEHIVRDVFNAVDGIVVPSIWAENAPLVIHEAQQARVPVITADAGGMRELVADGVNGYLHAHRDAASLATAISRALANPFAFASLGHRGYLGSDEGEVPHIDSQVAKLQQIYEELVA